MASLKRHHSRNADLCTQCPLHDGPGSWSIPSRGCRNCQEPKRLRTAVLSLPNECDDLQAGQRLQLQHSNEQVETLATSSTDRMITERNASLTRSHEGTVSLPNHDSHGAPAGDSETEATVDDDIWARNLNQTNRDPADHTIGTESVVSPQDSDSTQANGSNVRKHVKFAGETLAHSLLPLMDGHTELSASYDVGNAVRVNRKDLQRPIPPSSGHPHGRAPWINADCQAHLNLLNHLSPEDRYYLYSIKRVFRFPQRSVGAELIRIFLRTIYPLLPIVDRTSIQESFIALYRQEPVSPLLFHAIFFAASPFADEKILKQAGFKNCAEAKTFFFARAKILYSLDCEPDHFLVLQSLILLSLWWMDYTEEKDMRYWINCAVTLALTMGMHQAIPKSMTVSLSHRNLWRRVFWILFAREHNIAVALGMPFSLHISLCNLPLPCEEDFAQDVASTELINSGAFYEPERPECLVHVGLKYVQLAIRLEELLIVLHDVREPGETITALSRMEHVIAPALLDIPSAALGGFSMEDSATWNSETVFMVFLRLYHERIITLYHRRRQKALKDAQRISNQNSLPTLSLVDVPDAVDIAHNLREVRTAIYSSASRVVWMLDNIRIRGLLRFAPSFVNTTSFHAILTLIEEIIIESENDSRQMSAKERFDTGIRALQELRKYWSAASWSYAMFSDLARNDFKPLRAQSSRGRDVSRLPSRIASRFTSPTPGDEPIWNWDTDFLEAYQYFEGETSFSFDNFADGEDGNI